MTDSFPHRLGSKGLKRDHKCKLVFGYLRDRAIVGVSDI
jgi:hypothetical protein